MEPLGHGDGKKLRYEEKLYLNAFAFTHKSIVFPKKICILLQNYCIPPRNFVSACKSTEI